MRRLLGLILLIGGAALGRPGVHAEPTSVVLGRDHEVRITVTGPEKLAWKASEGELTQIDATHLTWHAPESGSPRTALLLFWDAAEARPNPAVVRIPLVGRTDLEIDTEPRANVTVEVARHSFGPRTASGRGRVKVPIEVPPGVETAIVRAEVNGRTTERSVDLGLPPDEHLLAALSPHPIDPKDGGWLMVAGVGPTKRAAIRIDTPQAQVEPVGTGDPLLYSVTPSVGAQEVVATVAVKDQPGSRVMTAAAVGASPPSGECVASAPPVLDLGATAGAFSGTGAAKGLDLSVLVGLSWEALSPRWELELELGWRHTGFSQAEPLGTLHSSINVLPILAWARFQAYARGPWTISVRAGGGVAPYDHRLSADYQQSFREGGVTWELAAGAEGGYRVGPWEPFLELGYAYSPRIQTPQVSARLSGPRVLAGVRWWLP